MTPPTRMLDRRAFDHVGIPTDELKEGAVWVEADGVWLTSPRDHPLNIEWVRYAEDSPMHPRLRESLHIAYRTEDLEAELRGREVIVPPLDLGGGFATIAFVDVGGTIVEFMEYADPDEKGWVS